MLTYLKAQVQIKSYLIIYEYVGKKNDKNVDGIGILVLYYYYYFFIINIIIVQYNYYVQFTIILFTHLFN